MIDEIMSICSIQSQMVKDLELQFPAHLIEKNNEEPIKQFKENINVKDNCVPIFCKAYEVHYALRDSVKKDLLSLENKGILYKINYSQWTSPIVCVPKKNVTLNKCVLVDQYPLPKIEDLFQKFHECNVFCQIDLSNAYLQLEVDKSSRKFFTINTICGLYVYNCLCFGLSPASAIFQSVIDKILEGIKYCDAYQDDILIGGKDYNVKMNIQKSLEMLGYILSADGISPCKSKIEKLIITKSLQNIMQLKSYIGLFNHQNGS
ncbi:hypothetical protein PR048_026664 [Dryococelus australis]|uniref:Reverse transcriptase domain-containing protein n=1 Tax=Dryococelus australis TaxID=614101 RepID=A0ABQ9GLZ5_9NEOP|nr:hypothetical protein PR048_026664 [Dryococelus australis]